MKGRGFVVAAAALGLAMIGLAVVVLSGQAPDGASTLSRDGAGWLAARRYLEERGVQVTLLDRALDEGPVPGVLVLSFPWPGPALDDVGGAIRRHLQTGGAVVFAYGGDEDPTEGAVLEALDLDLPPRRARPPLLPWRWRRYAAEEWTLTPDAGRDLRPARVAATRRAPLPPPDARILLFGPEARPVAFLYRRWGGRVAVVPADAFANARLGTPGNADLLELLKGELGRAWSFDEFHHGRRAPAAAAMEDGGNVFVLFLLQIGLVYLLCALAVGRRFGPAWRDPSPASGSAATFLVGLGALHHRLGHHAEAGRLLVARARELDPRLAVEDERPRDARTFLGLARRVGAAQAGRSA